MTDIVLSVASKVAEYLVALRRHSSYVMFSGSYNGQLKEELEKLENARRRVQFSIDEAQQEMKLIKAHPEKWVTDVENIVDMVQNALEHDERAKKTFFFGWLPNLKERYRLGREVTRTVRAIQASIRQGQLEMVYCRHAPSRHVVGALDVNSSADHWGDTVMESRASILEKIMNDLDDEKLKVIGIYGQDGVGKTNLLEEVEKKLRSEKRSFDVITKVKVSPTPKLKNIQDGIAYKNIQDGIAYAFSLNLKDELSEEGRRDRLFREIQSDSTKKVLIILEDLWGALDLKKVGIPSGDESRGCKLLLTSRFEDVLAKEMHADRTIHLEGLNNDEPFKLFEKIVRDRLKDEKLKPIAAKVVKKLAGLPLLITSVASTLKYSNMFVWQKVLIKIGESNIDAVTDQKNNRDAIVKFCYDNLKSEDAKSLFLLCGLIGGTIQVETLLVLGMGLGLFEGSFKRIEGSRELLKTSIDTLRSVCLLLDGGDVKEHVTINDLYSEVVVSTPLRGENSLVMSSNYDSWSTEKLVKCWAIYLVDVVDGKLAKLMSCWFTDLKILMLSQLEDWLGSPAHRHDKGDCCRLDFTYMKDLQVLYLRSMHITTLPSSIENLKNLLSLFLDNCLVEDAAILGKLKALQFLSFAGSSISRLPKEMGELKKLRLLNLSNCKKLKIIEPDVLNGLVNLEELYMKGSFDRWLDSDEIPSKSSNARFVELRSLTKLTTLEISILDATVILNDDSIKKNKISEVNSAQKEKIAEAFDKEMKKLEEEGSVQKEKISEATDEEKKKRKEISDQIEKILKDYQDYSIRKQKISEFNSLQKEIFLTACYKVKKKFEEEGLVQIKKISEDYDQPFGNLIRFWISIGNLDGREFEGLRTMKLRLEGCNDIFSIEWVQKTLQKTQYLHVDGLRQFKNIQDLFTRGFRELKHLDIDNSPSIECIIHSSIGLHHTPFTILESLFLKNLINLEKICNTTMAPECFGKLKAVHIEKCHQLKNLWLQSEIQRLRPKEKEKSETQRLRPKEKEKSEMQRFVHLEEIQVRECDSMQAIMSNDVGKVEVADYIIELPNVRRLDLRKLGNLTSSSNIGEDAAIQVEFPNLEALHISDMGHIKMIWDNHVALSFPRCFQYLKTLDVSYCDELSNMFTPIIVGNLVELTKLRISNCNKLTEVIRDEGGKEGPVVAFKQLKYIQLEELRGLTCFSSGRYVLRFPLLEDIIVTGCRNIKFFSEAPIGAPKLKKVQGSTGTWFCNGNIKKIIQKLAMVDGVEFMHLYQEKGHSDLISIKPSKQLKSLVVEGYSFVNAIPSGLMDELDKINTLQVQDCEQLEEIFGLEKPVAKKSTPGLPQLWALNLVNLPKLRQLWSKDFQGTLCFSSLSYLTLYKCNNLRHAFAPSMARCLPMLKWMEIKECDQMEGVIAEEKGDGSAVEKITFPILCWIELERLPNMTAFLFSMNHALECPVLQELTIAHCRKMITFTWQSLMKIEQGVSSPFTPQVLFPRVKSMVLSHVDSSSKMWDHSSQHSRKDEAFDKLRAEFCVIKEIGLSNVT